MKITIVRLCDDEVGECEGALDENDNVLHWWSLNDADFRMEYFKPLFDKLGVEINDEPTKKQIKILKKAVKADIYDE